MTRRSALARSGNAPTALVRRLISRLSLSRPLVESDAGPVLLRKGVEMRRCREAVVEALHGFWHLLAQARPQRLHELAGLRLARRLEQLRDLAGEAPPEPLRRLGEDISE